MSKCRSCRRCAGCGDRRSGRDVEPIRDLTRRESLAASRSTSTSRRVSRPDLRLFARGRSRLAVSRGHEHRTARAKLERLVIRAGETPRPHPEARTADGLLARRSPDVDLRRRQDASSEIVGVGLHALVVTGSVRTFVVRGRDRVRRREPASGAHLLGQHRVKLDPIELRPRERPRLVPDRVRHDFGTKVVPNSIWDKPGCSRARSSTGSSFTRC